MGRATLQQTGYFTFPTQLGWMAISGTPDGVTRLTFGHPSEAAAIKSLGPSEQADESEWPWLASVTERLKQFAAGERVSFDDLPVDLPTGTPFQEQVRIALRQVPYGETITYLDLSVAAGRPRAARAVGAVMARNPVPLILPCHRVTGSYGNLGGYSAPQGLDMKRRLLALEQGKSR